MCIGLSPINVVHNRWMHISSEEKQNEIRSANFLKAGRKSDRFHDGALRSDSAPPCAFGLISTSDEKIPTASFHPVFAEPGEVTSTLAMDLAMFTRNPGEYKLYLASLSPTGYKKNAGAYRLTLLLARESDWAWASENLLELPMFDNPIFSCSLNTKRDGNVGSDEFSGSTTMIPGGNVAGNRPKHKRPVFRSFKDLRINGAEPTTESNVPTELNSEIEGPNASEATQKSSEKVDQQHFDSQRTNGADTTWTCASRFHLNGDAVSVPISTVVLGVANGAPLSDASPEWFDSVKVGKVRREYVGLFTSIL